MHHFQNARKIHAMKVKLKGLLALFQVILQTKMSDWQLYPWVLYLVNNLEHVVFFPMPV